MINYKYIILLIALILFSCTKNSNSNQQNYSKEPEFRITRSFIISLPNKNEMISYHFSRSAFDVYESVEIDLIKENDGVKAITKVEHHEEFDKPISFKKPEKVFSYNIDKLSYLTKKISQIDIDTCIVYNKYSKDNDIISEIFFVHENRLQHISYNGRMCSSIAEGKKRTPLDSTEFEIRKYIMDIGAWDRLVLSQLSSSSSSNNIKTTYFKNGGLDLNPLFFSSSSNTPKIIDTIYFKKNVMDSSLTQNVNIFYPLKSLCFSLENIFIKEIDSMPYYKANLEGDSILYIWNKPENGEVISFKDNDTTSFFDIIKSLSLYEKEEWNVSRKGCPRKTEDNYIYWNNSSLNIIPFTCINEKLKIWDLNRKVREWLESKFTGK